MLNKERKKQNRHRVIPIFLTCCDFDRLFQIIYSLDNARNLFDLLKITIETKDFQEMRIGIMVTNLTLGESITNRSDFRFWKLFIDISSESLDANLDLCDSKHGIFEGISLSFGDIDLEILHI